MSFPVILVGYRHVRYHEDLEYNSQGHLKSIPIISHPIGYGIIKNVLHGISAHPCLEEFVFSDIENLVDACNTLKDVVGLEG